MASLSLVSGSVAGIFGQLRGVASTVPNTKGSSLAWNACKPCRIGGRIPVIEVVEERRHAQRGLLPHQPLRGPSVQCIPRGRQNALLQVRAGIESQEFVGEIEIALANDALIIGGIRGRPGSERSERTDLAAIEAGDQRHSRLFPSVEDIH